jgi:ABC-type uncharacterized transport system fused permease/ATPase subunit
MCFNPWNSNVLQPMQQAGGLQAVTSYWCQTNSCAAAVADVVCCGNGFADTADWLAGWLLAGKIEFGVINQSSSAFNHILNDVSLVVYQVRGSQLTHLNCKVPASL